VLTSSLCVHSIDTLSSIDGHSDSLIRKLGTVGELQAVHTYAARCCAALVNASCVFTTAALQRAAQRMCKYVHTCERRFMFASNILCFVPLYNLLGWLGGSRVVSVLDFGAEVQKGLGSNRSRDAVG